MREKASIKIGIKIRVITGKHRNSDFIVKGIDRKRGVVFLENVSRIISVANKIKGKRQPKEVFSPIHISNVRPIEGSVE